MQISTLNNIYCLEYRNKIQMLKSIDVIILMLVFRLFYSVIYNYDDMMQILIVEDGVKMRIFK
jgi:hypothetical protein